MISGCIEVSGFKHWFFLAVVGRIHVFAFNCAILDFNLNSYDIVIDVNVLTMF